MLVSYKFCVATPARRKKIREDNSEMKFRTYGMVLSLLFALGLVFSFSIEASADDADGTGIAAGDVDPTSEEDVKAFLGHLIDYYNRVVDENMGDNDALNREVTIYGRQIRQEGDYKNSEKNMYSMGINARKIVTNHARYPNLFGYKFDPAAADSEVASTIKTLMDDSAVGSTECEQYGDEGRVACATKITSTTGDVTVIAGLHHAENDAAFDLPDCTGFSLGTNAQTVFESQSDADLEAYVKGVIQVSQQLIADTTADVFLDFLKGGGVLTDLADPAKQTQITLGVSQRLFDKAACFRSMDIRHKSIYAFIMDANPAVSTVLFNGHNFDLNGANLELDDDSLPGDDKSIAGLFNRALEGSTSAYVNYRWDDPTTTEDDVQNFFRDRKVPGTSCKRSYIELADINARAADAVALVLKVPATTLAPFFPEQPYIFGSGTYPGDDVCASSDGGDSGDSDGCAIAGAGHASQGALLGLFLTAALVFSVAFLRKRA